MESTNQFMEYNSTFNVSGNNVTGRFGPDLADISVLRSFYTAKGIPPMVLIWHLMGAAMLAWNYDNPIVIPYGHQYRFQDQPFPQVVSQFTAQEPEGRFYTDQAGYAATLELVEIVQRRIYSSVRFAIRQRESRIIGVATTDLIVQSTDRTNLTSRFDSIHNGSTEKLDATAHISVQPIWQGDVKIPLSSVMEVLTDAVRFTLARLSYQPLIKARCQVGKSVYCPGTQNNNTV